MNIYIFVNVYKLPHIYGSTNQAFDKPVWWTHYALQTGNYYKTFSIEYTCFYFVHVLYKEQLHTLMERR